MKPDYAIIGEGKNGNFTVVTVDTLNASYQGIKWTDLGDWGKRKFENLLVITRAPERIKILYV